MSDFSEERTDVGKRRARSTVVNQVDVTCSTVGMVACPTSLQNFSHTGVLNPFSGFSARIAKFDLRSPQHIRCRPCFNMSHMGMPPKLSRSIAHRAEATAPAQLWTEHNESLEYYNTYLKNVIKHLEQQLAARPASASPQLAEYPPEMEFQETDDAMQRFIKMVTLDGSEAANNDVANVEVLAPASNPPSATLAHKVSVTATVKLTKGGRDPETVEPKEILFDKEDPQSF
ncbi:hypothetical protein HDV05_005480 [Chytridiales sp. JEL 0842]|nr:hypothetical protein HDV05_005480 [Chytridiales sp. JEL 0842]